MPEGLRAALERKQRRETVYDLIVEDPSDAEAELDAARQAHRLAELRGGDEDERAAARERYDAARAALAACTHRITFRNLPADLFEALVSAHPPEKGSDEEWDAKTFRPALIAACAVDSGMDEAEWAAELSSERWSTADCNAIFIAALSANITARSVSLPKD